MIGDDYGFDDEFESAKPKAVGQGLLDEIDQLGLGLESARDTND